MNTRFSDDLDRVNKRIDEQTGAARYIFDRPGPGALPAYQEDIHINSWNGVVWSNSTDLSSYLSGRGQTWNRYAPVADPVRVPGQPTFAPTSADLYTDQSRITMPAWMLRCQGRTPFDQDPSAMYQYQSPIIPVVERVGINARQMALRQK